MSSNKPTPAAGRSAADRPAASGRQRAATVGTDEKRERILAVAARLFFERGYAETTIEQIARELGVTKPYVYYYFRDKLELFETVSWRPTVASLSAMDFDASDPRPAHLKLAEGIERLIRVTLTHHPAATLPYREMQVYSPAYIEAYHRLADRFYERMSALLEQARNEGMAEFGDTRLTALAAASIPGFAYTWYHPDGRLPREEVVAELTRIALRAMGLRTRKSSRPAYPA
ncbi:MAG TPA: TetR/AcrR family transcriptional regulator [Burkholderiaceae bacterium]|nr:TetR/AcrR family transcriptional regulator [Burkholderiaceae bacterium]